MRGMTMISHSTLNLTLPRRAHFVLAIVAVLAMPILLASAPA